MSTNQLTDNVLVMFSLRRTSLKSILLPLLNHTTSDLLPIISMPHCCLFMWHSPCKGVGHDCTNRYLTKLLFIQDSTKWPLILSDSCGKLAWLCMWAYERKQQTHFLLDYLLYCNKNNQMMTELSRLGLEPLVNNLLYGKAMYSDVINQKAFLIIQQFIKATKRFS